jgi:hypothetical protein
MLIGHRPIGRTPVEDTITLFILMHLCPILLELLHTVIELNQYQYFYILFYR